MLPELHFGYVTQKPIDWRKHKDESKDDDALLPKTPPDVIGMLGFDPLKEPQE